VVHRSALARHPHLRYPSQSIQSTTMIAMLPGFITLTNQLSARR